MSLKWGSNYLWIGAEQAVELKIDDNAKIVTEEDQWKVEKITESKLANFSNSTIPKDSLDIVTTGELTKGWRGNTYCSTIGCAFKISNLINMGPGLPPAKAQFWDTAGQERFRTIGRSYYRGADIAIVVYDISCQSSGSTQNLRRWIEEVRSSNEDVAVVILGNKSDLEDKREVTFDSVKELAEEYNYFFCECSAKSGENLARGFARMFSECYMNKWKKGVPFSLIKVVIVGDSGTGKTSLFERMEGFSVDLSKLVKAYPIYTDTKVEKLSLTSTANENANIPVHTKQTILPDTNIGSLNLGLLSQWSSKLSLATGDPDLCKTCKSALSKHTKHDVKDGNWICDFCQTVNELHLDEEEIPTQSSLDYLEKGIESLESLQQVDLDTYVVFCIDTSGSMIVSSPIDSKYASKLRKNKHDMPELSAQDARQQYLPNEKRNVTYISRLESVQTAVEAQLIDLQQQHPNKRVALVSFSNDVIIYSDGVGVPTVLSGEKLYSMEELQKVSKWASSSLSSTTKQQSSKPKSTTNVLSDAQKLKLAQAKTKQEIEEILNSPEGEEVGVGEGGGEQSNDVVNVDDNAGPLELQPISKSREKLSSKLFSLSEEGQTALGPALLVSCALASMKSGSKVILCTDGLANVGVGSMESLTTQEIKSFYQNLAVSAIKKNVSISLMSFKGSDSNIEVLGEMASKTGGQVDIVDPAEVSKNFQSIFADDTIASDVSIKLFLPRGIRLHKTTIEMDDWKESSGDVDEDDDINEKKNLITDGEVEHHHHHTIYTKNIGSVNSDSNLLIRLAIDHKYFDQQKQEKIESFPLQMQITYTRAEDGKRLVRIISESFPATNTEKECYPTVDLEVLTLFAIRSVAYTAQQGHYTLARLENYANLQLIKKILPFMPDKEESNDIMNKYLAHNIRFETNVFNEQRGEISQGKLWDESTTISTSTSSGASLSSPSFFDSVGSFFGGLFSSNTTTSSSSSSSTSSISPSRVSENQYTKIQSQRSNRNDGFSNLLWNMRSSNML
eukprot:TRINITY_DN11969_c0_g1_i1.p1 TRINITY_DN11969_c0_g1~~TRINITY_DN11969_c0_g1_i1.p1  ORF type:complete len:1016 (-),score=296.96 TRINITY_DN11969_c0_g1_i1:118-3165(-)